MNPSSNSPGSSRHGKRPMILSSSSSSSKSSSSSPSSERTRYAATTAVTTAAVAAEEEGEKSLGTQADCYVCGRQFGNWKALFGHMRSHPEREWRGVRPLAEGEEGSRGRRKWRRQTGEETAEAAEAAATGEYACGECSRVFGTRQALGGHRASHRGVMGCSAKAKKTTAAASAVEMRGGGRGDGRSTFVCRQCGRQFATYHGMRIHQRVHPQGHEERLVGGREERGFMVDLNLPPPPEDLEVEVKKDES